MDAIKSNERLTLIQDYISNLGRYLNNMAQINTIRTTYDNGGCSSPIRSRY